MLAFKVALYVMTIVCAFFFGFWELKLRRRLTDEAMWQQHEGVNDYLDASYDIRKEIRRERVLKSLPPEALFRLRLIASLKFLLIAILVIEVIVLQR